jgi:predicted RNA-binding Zn-ribbon protein involved in translation (DUF1610 family)
LIIFHTRSGGSVAICREMSSYRGSGGKRLRMSPSDAEGSPKRSRNSRRRSPSPYSPSSYLSPSPSPSPYRSPSPSPCRSWSRRLPSDGDDDADDDRSRTRGSDEIDGHARTVWRPHANRELGEHGRGGEFSVQIDDYDRLFTCRSCGRMLSAPVYQVSFTCSCGTVLLSSECVILTVTLTCMPAVPLLPCHLLEVPR